MELIRNYKNKLLYKIMAKQLQLINQKNSPSLFIQKLYSILQDPNCNEIISWSQCETFFIIKNVHLLQTQTLPQYFRHKQLNSFVRQLNMYDFHKLRVCKKNQLAFKHADFTRANSQNYGNILRKGAKDKQSRSNKIQQDQHKINASLISIQDHPIEKNLNNSQKLISLGELPSFRFTCSKLSIGLNDKFGELPDVQQFESEDCQNGQMDDNISIVCEEQQQQKFWYDKYEKNHQENQTTKLLEVSQLSSLSFCFDL